MSESARRLGTRAVAVMLAALLVASCSIGPVLRGRIDGLAGVVTKAEQNGAMRCAPRELALAKSHLRFAATDLDQGSASEAEKHLAVAEPNAQAALSLSSRDRCTPQVTVVPEDPDTDGDGIPDARDACILEPEDKDGYLDDDGCPDLDNDGDGIPDALDKCPNDPEDRDGFEDQDGCPDPDNDKDAVLDGDDQCPNTPGSPGGARPGCPGLIVVTAREIRITQQIQFDFNKSTIKPVSFPILNEVRDVLRDNPKIKLEIQGHTDNAGNADYNLKLSQQRAASVTAYLVKNGVTSDRLIPKGYGMTQPLLKNDTEANRALNRRVQFIRTEAKP